jgi:lipid-binding SYLF domain-containing protein
MAVSVFPCTDGAKDEKELVQSAAAVLRDINTVADGSIPDGLWRRVRAIAVFPQVVKEASAFNVRFGKGVVSRLAGRAWESPVFVILRGRFGFEIGNKSTDVLLLFVDETTAVSLLRNPVTLGKDASVAAGPSGQSPGDPSSPPTPAIYAYCRSRKGVSGIALDGAVLSIDERANAAVYGTGGTGVRISGGKVKPTQVGRPFLDALAQYLTGRVSY